eukprot:SAG22_NODE_9882_length_565_cov_0.665236_1_plen_139_part_10
MELVCHVSETEKVQVWLAWGNPLFGESRGKWWDAECPAPLRIDGLATADDSNRVQFRICAGAGTSRKYADDGNTATSGEGGLGELGRQSLSQQLAATLQSADGSYAGYGSQAEVAAEIGRRREIWNMQVLPRLIQVQMK